LYGRGFRGPVTKREPKNQGNGEKLFSYKGGNYEKLFSYEKIFS
jgi:hypothetical protein